MWTKFYIHNFPTTEILVFITGLYYNHPRLLINYKIKVTAIAKIIQMHCHKGLSAAKVFKVLKGTVNCSGVCKAVKRFRETGSCLLKVRSNPERSVKTKKLFKNIREKLRRNPQKSTRKLAQEAHVSLSIMQRVLVNDLKVKPYKITK